jgi:hypothetical protein
MRNHFGEIQEKFFQETKKHESAVFLGLPKHRILDVCQYNFQELQHF